MWIINLTAQIFTGNNSSTRLFLLSFSLSGQEVSSFALPYALAMMYCLPQSSRANIS
jgi:hypothetical protein